MADGRWQVSWAQLRVLIVEDHVHMMRTIRNILLRLGVLHADEAGDGVEAWMKLQEQECDFIIADWNMPNMNGAELLKKVRASNKHRGIPFLMVTGEAEMGKAAQAAERDVDDYILKPFTISDLQMRMERILRRHHQPSAWEECLKRGDRCCEKGDPDGALHEYEEALHMRPGNAKILHRIGEAYRQKGELQRASECYGEALKANPLYIKAYDGLCDICVQQTMWDEALRVLQKALEISPNNAERHIKVGRIYLSKGKVDSAKSHFKKASNLEPDNDEVLKAVADIYFDHQLYAEAEEIFRSIQKRFPEDISTFTKLAACRRNRKPSEMVFFEG